MSTKKTSQIADARREYLAAKKLRNQLGKKAKGKPKKSTVYRDYKLVDGEYHRAGQRLGRLTGLKARR